MFCFGLTHCDSNTNFDREPKILDEIVKNQKHYFDDREVSHIHDKQGAMKVYEQFFKDECMKYQKMLSDELKIECKMFMPISCQSEA